MRHSPEQHHESRDLIGTVVRLQAQESSLKLGEMPWRRYDPAPLRSVPALRLEEGGVIGLPDWGDDVIDVHHQEHPASKNLGGGNGISICFTSHYELMRERFGEHLTDGLAGENILVATDQAYGEDDLAGGIVVATGDGSVRLDQIVVAAPCVEFSRYAMQFPETARPDRTVSEALAFLNDGMRGYYATYTGKPATVRVGDRVYLGSDGSS